MDVPAGPGMLYAHDVVMALHRAAIHCFSGLHAPAGVNWSIYFNKFKGRLPKCKVFIVRACPPQPPAPSEPLVTPCESPGLVS